MQYWLAHEHQRRGKARALRCSDTAAITCTPSSSHIPCEKQSQREAWFHVESNRARHVVCSIAQQWKTSLDATQSHANPSKHNHDNQRPIGTSGQQAHGQITRAHLYMIHSAGIPLLLLPTFSNLMATCEVQRICYHCESDIIDTWERRPVNIHNAACAIVTNYRIAVVHLESWSIDKSPISYRGLFAE